MKVQCPHCSKTLSVPDAYKGQKIRCKDCNKSLMANPIKPENTKPFIAPLPVQPHPEPNPQKGMLAKIWSGSPVAFRTAFLATLGVVSALLFTWYTIDISRLVTSRLNSNKTRDSTENPHTTTPKPSIVQPKTAENSSDTMLTSENVRALTLLSDYNGRLESLHVLRGELCSSSTKSLAAQKSLFANLDPLLQLHKKNARNLKLLSMPESTSLDPSFADVKLQYLNAMAAEVEVLKLLIAASKNRKFDDNWEGTVNKANDLCAEARFQLIFLFSLVNPLGLE